MADVPDVLGTMLYEAYQAHSDFMAPTRTVAGMGVRALRQLNWAPPYDLIVRNLSASLSLIADTKLTHARPPFGIETVVVDGHEVAVREEATDATPFATLLHFAKDDRATQPRVLLVSPLSGHFATLVRETVRTLLPDHDVYLTDWHNARDIPLDEGRFGFDEYTDHVIRFLEHLGAGAHLIAVCQPCVEALVATAVLAAGRSPATPSSLTLMAGPIDTRIAPTAVNEWATSHPIDWFERTVVATVPGRYPGAGRQVYPGFLQLMAFVSMNPGRHIGSHRQMFLDLVTGDLERAAATRSFYDEYFAVLDLTAEFYLETVQQVFQEHLLPRGLLTHHGEPVEVTAIRRTALLTIEGERDDICSAGQTLAAHDLCTGIKPFRKRHHLQPGVGHYGVFSGRRWDTQIYPIVRNHISNNE
jgi:poly(3-hydroxybutyrate) depolymerase